MKIFKLLLIFLLTNSPLQAEQLADPTSGDGTITTNCLLSGRAETFANSLRKRIISQIVSANRYIIERVRVRPEKALVDKSKKASFDPTSGVQVLINPESENKISLSGTAQHGNLFPECPAILVRFRILIVIQDSLTSEKITIRDVGSTMLEGAYGP